MELEILSKQIKLMRKQRGLTQEQLAELVGLHEKQISKIETGRCFPTYKNLMKILSVLQIKCDDINNLFSDKLDDLNVKKTALLKIINLASENEIDIYYAIIKELKKVFNNKAQ